MFYNDKILDGIIQEYKSVYFDIPRAKQVDKNQNIRISLII